MAEVVRAEAVRELAMAVAARAAAVRDVAVMVVALSVTWAGAVLTAAVMAAAKAGSAFVGGSKEAGQVVVEMATVARGAAAVAVVRAEEAGVPRGLYETRLAWTISDSMNAPADGTVVAAATIAHAAVPIATAIAVSMEAAVWVLLAATLLVEVFAEDAGFSLDVCATKLSWMTDPAEEAVVAASTIAAAAAAIAAATAVAMEA